MARKRMISPTIWEDPAFNRLSIPARLLFIGIISNADDEGYIRANSGSLKRLIFGYDEIVSSELWGWIEEVKKLKNIHFFEVAEEEYAHLLKWSVYQKLREDRLQESTYPKCTLCGQVPDKVRASAGHLPAEDRIGKDSNAVESTQHASLEGNKKKMDYEYEPVDRDGSPLTRNSKGWEKRPPRQPRNKQALALVHRFGDMAVQKLKLKQKPVTAAKDYLAALKAISTLSEKQIEDHMKDWFGSGQPTEHLIHFSKAFSISQINTVIGK